MRVRNLSAWAGTDFSCAHGAEIDLPDDVAEARIAAGLAEALTEPEQPAAPDAPPKRRR